MPDSTKSNSTTKKRKKIAGVLLVLVALLVAGAYSYVKATDVVSEKLMTKVAQTVAASDSDSTSTTAAKEIYQKMSGEDKAKVKSIAKKHMTLSNVAKVQQYLSDNDTEGLKEYAYETLSDNEISQLKELYSKYSSEK